MPYDAKSDETALSATVPLDLKVSIGGDFLPQGWSWARRFALARDAGFDGIEMYGATRRAGGGVDTDLAAQVAEGAAASGLPIHSVFTNVNWIHPLTDSDEKSRSIGIKATIASLECARLWGADTLLLIPGVVTAAQSYARVYDLSQRVIRDEILPAAKDLGVTLAVENGWYGFLTSPYEFARYIDEFESPLVRAYLDTGNMPLGNSHHWIPIVGKRILKLHIKDFWIKKGEGQFGFGPVGSGDVHWDRVVAELKAIGFSGWAHCSGVERGVLTRAGDVIARHPRRGALNRIPLASPSLEAVQRALAVRRLRDTVGRFNRVFR